MGFGWAYEEKRSKADILCGVGKKIIQQQGLRPAIYHSCLAPQTKQLLAKSAIRANARRLIA